ncbi:MAG: hypothetical protein LBG60_17260, partial [Bifidobacteriaceae bacterium]|nr:hypothetical protein [Bifidobacteriaceae bacterium]
MPPLQPESLLARYKDRVQTYTAQLLEGYLERLEMRKTPVRAKEFNDPVWGTVTLNGAEVALLDSPLLQRLRRIRQLGVVHLVFPGANHTRLEHSIGVCHQVQRMADAIIQHSGVKNPDVVNLLGRGGAAGDWLQVLRFAALCHDVGHGFMSHVSENALAITDAYRDLGLEFSNAMEDKRQTSSQLSEIAAYYMLTSGPFQRLIELSMEKAQDPLRVEDAARRVANCVIGVSDDPRIPLVHEFISGPFDCDKLDYMTRDAMMCGVPIVTDVNRLIQKARAKRAKDDDLQGGLSELPQTEDGVRTIIAIDHSGASTLDELALGRSLVHNKVYRHHKVRAAEAMVAAIVHEMPDDADAIDWLTLPLSTDDSGVVHWPPEAPWTGRIPDTPVARDISRRLRDRDLFVRAFAFSQRVPGVTAENGDSTRASLQAVMSDSSGSDKRQELVSVIANEALKMAELVGRGEQIKQLFEGGIKPYIWLSAPPGNNASTVSVVRGCLLRPDGSVSLLEREAPAIRGVSDAYLNATEIGYVFCPKEIADLVYVATEVALHEKYNGLTIDRSMGSVAHIDMKAVEELRGELFRTGYYTAQLRVLRPEPGPSKDVAFRRGCEAAAGNLAAYQGPSMAAGVEKSGYVTAAKVKQWVLQFPDDLIDDALKIARAIMVIDRNAANDTLRGFLTSAQGGEFNGAAVVPLGSAKDSSAILPYFVGDLRDQFGLDPTTLTTALATPSRPIVFVDDIIQQGLTVAEIVAEWVGEEPLLNQGVQRDPALNESAIKELRARRVAIVAFAGGENGVETARRVLEHHGLDGLVYCHHDGYDGVPRVETVLTNAGSSTADEFMKHCRRVGEELLAPDERAEERA